jgi:hypothetical protein
VVFGVVLPCWVELGLVIHCAFRELVSELFFRHHIDLEVVLPSLEEIVQRAQL